MSLAEPILLLLGLLSTCAVIAFVQHERLLANVRKRLICIEDRLNAMAPDVEAPQARPWGTFETWDNDVVPPNVIIPEGTY